jgi:L,D-peptidoglycan transpeptidase YkuD (ErfK/YbiS/YcfS/YnhG family)
MIIVKAPGYIKYKNLKLRCSIGRSGIKKKIKEGDNITPKGKFKIIKIYYRSDRVKKFSTNIKTIKIKRNMGWCDDPKSSLYNKEIKLPFDWSHEKLYRNDHLYDLILVLNYNMNPIKKNKGSAIFFHIANKSYKKTKGCIGLKKVDLINLISKIKKNTTIKIS